MSRRRVLLLLFCSAASSSAASGSPAVDWDRFLERTETLRSPRLRSDAVVPSAWDSLGDAFWFLEFLGSCAEVSASVSVADAVLDRASSSLRDFGLSASICTSSRGLEFIPDSTSGVDSITSGISIATAFPERPWVATKCTRDRPRSAHDAVGTWRTDFARGERSVWDGDAGVWTSDAVGLGRKGKGSMYFLVRSSGMERSRNGAMMGCDRARSSDKTLSWALSCSPAKPSARDGGSTSSTAGSSSSSMAASRQYRLVLALSRKAAMRAALLQSSASEGS